MRKVYSILFALCLSLSALAVDWSGVAFVGNGSGDAANTDKWKVATPEGVSVINIQTPGFATAPGFYITLPDAAFTDIKADGALLTKDVQGAGIILHLTNFTYQETHVEIYNNATLRWEIDVFKADGLTGPKKIYDTNFALASQGSSATASSGNAAAAIDGNNGSRWESASTDTEWWILDMGQERIFTQIQIRWETAYTKTFDILASNDTTGDNWTTIKQVVNQSAGNNTEKIYDFDEEQSYRFIKFQAIQRATGWGNSFFEFRVLYPGVSVLTTLTLAAPELAQVGVPAALTLTAKDQNGAPYTVTGETYTINPADAGAVANRQYTPAKKGAATIQATAEEVSTNTVTVFAYAGANVALHKPVYDLYTAETPAGIVNNGNEGDVWQGITGSSAATKDEPCGFVMNLETYYDLELITIKFEGACSQNYVVSVSADSVTWSTAYEHVGTAGINGRTDMIYPGAAKDLQNNTKVKYVRFVSTKQATDWGCKIYEMKVFGTDWVPSSDVEKPVMGEAALVSNTYNQAVISVAATDNGEVKDFHVVDAANSIDLYTVANEGKITVRGLTPSTTYNFTISARDMALNESDNSAVVAVTTDGFLTEPAEPVAAPTVPASRVVKVYTDAYEGADFSAHEGWGDATVFTPVVFSATEQARLYSSLNWLGWAGGPLNCLNMEKLHIDIWADVNGQLGIVPIYGGAGLTTDDSHRKIVTLVGQQWNSFDLDLATDFAGLNLASIFQFKFDNAQGDHFCIDNVYFYRTTDLVDDEAPQALTARMSAASYFFVTLTAYATDNMGAVNYIVKNGDVEVASKAAVSGDSTTINVLGLSAGTTYNFTVVAEDASENATEPVAVTATTLAGPAPAPAPTAVEADVLSLYSDAYDFAPASLASYNEGWWAAPSMAVGTLAEGENVLYYYGATNTGMIGWQYAPIDVTAYDSVHIDIYPLQAGTIKVGPTMAMTVVELQANQWNSFNLAFEAATDEQKAGMFQFEMIDYYSLGSFFVDNVYFFKAAAAPVVEPDMEYELNGGALAPAAQPTNAELWEAFKPYYNSYYSLNRADQPITFVSTFASAKMQEIMTDEASEYKWLGDYVASVCEAAGMPLASESNWRWEVHAFFNCVNTALVDVADFTVAGQPAAWKAAWDAAHPAVAMPEFVTEAFTMPEPAKEGYIFAGWFWNEDFSGDVVTVLEVGATGTLYAKWESTVPTALDNVESANVVKFMQNGQLFIMKNGVIYNAIGQIVK